MRNTLIAFVIWPALLGATLCATAAAQLPSLNDSPDEGLVGGKREMVCPHSSARALRSFVQSNASSASATANSFYAGDSGGRWAYLRVGEKSIQVHPYTGR